MGPRLTSLLVKELIQFSRDRVTLILILFLYTAEVIMCTMALSFDVRDLALAVIDYDRTALSRSLQERFSAVREFRLINAPASEAEAGQWLQSGKATIALVIREGFARDLERGVVPAVQVLLDASNSNTAVIARGYVLRVLEEFQHGLSRILAAPHSTAQPVLRVWYNPDLAFSWFMVLSMIGLAAMMAGVIQPATSIVREKEVGTIEQLLVTPVRTAELFMAKTAPTLFLCLVAVFPSLLVAQWFQVPLRGELWFFLLMTALFLFSAIGLGVLIGTVSRSLQQALLLSFFGLFPIMLLSGTFVSVESMPEFLQTLSLVSPLRHYMDVILGVFLKGAGIAELWAQALALLALGASLFGLAGLVFRKGA